MAELGTSKRVLNRKLKKLQEKRLTKMSPNERKKYEEELQAEYARTYTPDPPELFQETAGESQGLNQDYIIDTDDEENEVFGGGKRRKRSKRRRRRPSTKKRVTRKSHRSKTRRSKSRRAKSRRRSNRRSRRN